MKIKNVNDGNEFNKLAPTDKRLRLRNFNKIHAADSLILHKRATWKLRVSRLLYAWRTNSFIFFLLPIFQTTTYLPTNSVLKVN